MREEDESNIRGGETDMDLYGATVHRECCGCGKKWSVSKWPVMNLPPHSCGKPECNQRRDEINRQIRGVA